MSPGTPGRLYVVAKAPLRATEIEAPPPYALQVLPRFAASFFAGPSRVRR
jgi:hypothetical protein